jgi:CAP, N-terminal domain
MAASADDDFSSTGGGRFPFVEAVCALTAEHVPALTGAAEALAEVVQTGTGEEGERHAIAVREATQALCECIQEQEKVVRCMPSAHRPGNTDEWGQLLQAPNAAIYKVETFQMYQGPDSPVRDELSLLREATGGFVWVATDMGRVDFVRGAAESAEFYSNKVLRKAKNTPSEGARFAFVGAVEGFLQDLQQYVTEFHKDGTDRWNEHGARAVDVLEGLEVTMTKSARKG